MVIKKKNEDDGLHDLIKSLRVEQLMALPSLVTTLISCCWNFHMQICTKGLIQHLNSEIARHVYIS